MKYSIIFILILFCGWGNAQSHIDRHSSVTSDAWLSCATSANPNSSRGTGHWIRYDLGRNYSIANIDIWNFNHPDSLNLGIRDAYIDISLDGVTWTSMGQFTVPRATGSTLYPGAKSVHSLGFQPARHVLITPINNHGGSTCFGFAEIQFHLSGSFLPVVFSDLQSTCFGTNVSFSWKSNNEKNIVSYEVLGSDDATSWTQLSTHPSKGSGNYEALLNKNDALYYLKIVAHEQDGKFTESEITVNECNNLSASVKLQPNPFSSYFDIILPVSESVKPQSLRILDLSGREIYKQTVQNASNVLSIYPPDFNKGIYLAEITMYGDKKFVQKIVKM